MGVNAVNSQRKLQDIKAGQSSDGSSIERKIEQLRKQLEQIKKNKQLSPDEKEKRMHNIQKQIDHLQKQKAEASRGERQQDASSVQAEKVQDAEKAGMEDLPAAKHPSADWKRRFDTFEPQAEPQTAGVYALSHDEEGKPVIKFDDPAKETAEKTPNPDPEDGAKPQIVKTTVNTDAVDREIETLKKSLAETKQQLSSTSDPKEKELLEQQLSQLEAALKQKDSEAYRRQHGQITEQKVVSAVGE